MLATTAAKPPLIPGFYLGHGIEGFQQGLELWGIKLEYYQKTDALLAALPTGSPKVIIVDLDHFQYALPALFAETRRMTPIFGSHSVLNEQLTLKMYKMGVVAVFPKRNLLEVTVLGQIHALSLFATDTSAVPPLPVHETGKLKATLPFVECHDVRVVLKTGQVVGGILDGARLKQREFELFMLFAKHSDQSSLSRHKVEKIIWGRYSLNKKDRLRRTLDKWLSSLNAKVGGNHFKIHD